MSNLWELEEALAALDAGATALAHRYLEKALEHVQCMYCHGPQDGRETRQHYKGWIHIECEQYHGRGDYERKNPDDPRNYQNREQLIAEIERMREADVGRLAW